MDVTLEESLKIATQLKKKRDSGKELIKGEKIILTLAEEYVTIYNRNSEKNKKSPNNISDEACVDLITFYKKKVGDKSVTNILANKDEFNMLLTALLERLYND